MVRKGILLIFIFSLGFGQESDPEPDTKPWDSPVFVKVQEGGIGTLTIKEYPLYLKCFYQTIRTREGRAVLSRLDADRMEKDYERSREYHGWTVSCSMVTGLIVTMFYIEKLF